MRTKGATYTRVAPHDQRVQVAFCVIQTKGNSNGDSAAGPFTRFYAVLMFAAAGTAAWLYKKRKENDTDLIF